MGLSKAGKLAFICVLSGTANYLLGFGVGIAIEYCKRDQSTNVTTQQENDDLITRQGMTEEERVY